MRKDFKVAEDIQIIKELMDITDQEFANTIGVSVMSLCRWAQEPNQISNIHMESIYEYAFKSNIKLNKLKEQLYIEEFTKEDSIVLFHGSKSNIDGELTPEKSQGNKDFGKGFYCGENLEQSAMFVCNYPNSSLYILQFKKDKNLKFKKFKVDRDWMITIAYFRKKIDEYVNCEIVKNLINEISNLDYIIAPIADNRMFEIIDDFIYGNITDIQCEHALSATNLGYQYVFLNKKVLENVKILDHCYLSSSEKQYYINKKEEENKIGNDKAKLSKREYRGQGLYIDQLLL